MTDEQESTSVEELDERAWEDFEVYFGDTITNSEITHSLKIWKHSFTDAYTRIAVNVSSTKIDLLEVELRAEARLLGWLDDANWKLPSESLSSKISFYTKRLKLLEKVRKFNNFAHARKILELRTSPLPLTTRALRKRKAEDNKEDDNIVDVFCSTSILQTNSNNEIRSSTTSTETLK